MILFSILQLSPDFVWKGKHHIVFWEEINSLNDVFVVPFVKDPAKEDLVKTMVRPIYNPIIMGRLAGKVRYPNLVLFYKGCIESGRSGKGKELCKRFEESWEWTIFADSKIGGTENCASELYFKVWRVWMDEEILNMFFNRHPVRFLFLGLLCFNAIAHEKNASPFIPGNSCYYLTKHLFLY